VSDKEGTRVIGADFVEEKIWQRYLIESKPGRWQSQEN
jgi:hypothetical protein